MVLNHNKGNVGWLLGRTFSLHGALSPGAGYTVSLGKLHPWQVETRLEGHTSRVGGPALSRVLD